MRIILLVVVLIGNFFPAIAVSRHVVGFLAGSGGLGDDSFNDMTHMGLGRARDELGFKLAVREWEPGLEMTQLVNELIEEGAELIVLNGSQFLPLIRDNIDQYVAVNFIANDFDGGGYHNVKSIVYDQNEISFLAGALTGWQSDTNKVSFIGAIDIPVVKSFLVGFQQGVSFASPTTEVVVEYISLLPDYSGFNNPRKGYELALAHYKGGSDIIFAVAGLSGNGVIHAAKECQKFVVGVDSDQDHMAKGYVLTSVMKRLDNAVYKEVSGTLRDGFESGSIRYGLSNNGMELSPMKYTKDLISSVTLKKLQDVENRIRKGDLKVADFTGFEQDEDEKTGKQR